MRHQCCCGTLLCLRHHVCSGNGISRLLGLYEPGGWRSADLVIVVLALVGFAALGSVPWIVTTPVADDGEEKVAAARRALALGVVLIWLSVLVSVLT
ncbi:hypothetical protein IE4771_PB00127 (plasmid) [Rhizobium etli bv. mimosae str. IE4771]|uniref:Uncharacterized protein n=1 Tax=Rhizobium etli bv. mimosae str. IE4771 TaxID=1432050 RepID=A0A060I3X8_RHIET|nr:hypothetical protein IE4771_PB00127 [Rhizobium sp. IE4771]